MYQATFNIWIRWIINSRLPQILSSILSYWQLQHTVVRKRNTIIPSYKIQLKTALRFCHVSHKVYGRQGKRGERQTGITGSDCIENLLIQQTLHCYWCWADVKYTRSSTANVSQQIIHIGLTIYLQLCLFLKWRI